MNSRTLKLLGCFLATAATIAAPGCDRHSDATDRAIPFKYSPIAIMGTETELTVTARSSQETEAGQALKSAEAALRAVESKMSSWLKASELSQFNDSPAGHETRLSETTLGLLRISGQLAKQTDGAFDVTCRPILQLWKSARESKRLPTDLDLARALGRCGWDKIRLQADSAVKTTDGASLDLGGIAKGFGIDKAIEAIRSAGMPGGMVNVGGDVRCFGQRPGGGMWRIGVKSPFDKNPTFRVIKISSGAVCTSGNYERFFEIDSKRYSHIVDPRTGRPVDGAPSVTVYAPTAAIADAWATALSVLGEAGLELIDKNSGIEAMLIIGGPEDYRIVTTPGMVKLLEQ